MTITFILRVSDFFKHQNLSRRRCQDNSLLLETRTVKWLPGFYQIFSVFTNRKFKENWLRNDINNKIYIWKKGKKLYASVLLIISWKPFSLLNVSINFSLIFPVFFLHHPHTYVFVLALRTNKYVLEIKTERQVYILWFFVFFCVF